MTALTAEIARALWRYEPETGYFFWIGAPRVGIKAGGRAGSFDGRYWRLQHAGKYYKASRVAWLVVTGAWPNHQIDHINRDKTDDKFCNLREATNAQNCRNRSTRKDNKLAATGVCRTRYAFVSKIYADGKGHHLGSFRSLAEAKAARDVAAARLHGDFAKL